MSRYVCMERGDGQTLQCKHLPARGDGQAFNPPIHLLDCSVLMSSGHSQLLARQGMLTLPHALKLCVLEAG